MIRRSRCADYGSLEYSVSKEAAGNAAVIVAACFSSLNYYQSYGYLPSNFICLAAVSDLFMTQFLFKLHIIN